MLGGNNVGVSAGGAGAIAIGRDAIGNIFVTGDYSQVFVGAYERLKDAYINPVSVLKRLRLEQFVGRGEVTSRLDDFFEKQRKGYFVLEGAAGLGKSALLAHLVTERGYIHHFVELAPGPEKVVDGLKSLAAQVIRAWLMDPSGVDSVLPTSAGRQDFLRTLLVDAAARRDELRGSEKIVVVIDALDEAAGPEGTNGFPLPPDLPEGVYFIVSQRPGTRLPVIQAPFKPFTIVADSPENLADMSEYLHAAVKRPKIAAALEAAESAAHNGQVTETELQDRLTLRRQNFPGHAPAEVQRRLDLPWRGPRRDRAQRSLFGRPGITSGQPVAVLRRVLDAVARRARRKLG
jgi:hypothetical protein